MEKIKLEHKTPKNKTIEYNDTPIEIIPFLALDKQLFLITNYVNEYFDLSGDVEKLIKDAKYNLFTAEYNHNMYLIQLNTNIDLENTEKIIYETSPLIEKIKTNISNYDVFRFKLDRIVADIKEQYILEKSIGSIVDKLSNEILEILKKFSEYTPESLEKAKNAGMEMIEELKKSSISLQPILSEEKAEKKKKKAK